MIAAHELRIGSKVLDGETIRTVTGIIYAATDTQVYLDGSTESKPLFALRPLLLSRELVIACCFEESEEGFWYEQTAATLYPIYLMVINNNWDFSLSDPREVAYWKRIYYFHQLQNLHYVLNAEELEVCL